MISIMMAESGWCASLRQCGIAGIIKIANGAGVYILIYVEMSKNMDIID